MKPIIPSLFWTEFGLFWQMSRYSGLLQRPNVGNALSQERSQLMAQLQQYARSLKEQLENRIVNLNPQYDRICTRD